MTTDHLSSRWGNLWNAFRGAVTRGADDPALSVADETWTYRRTGEAVGAVSAALAELGVRAGSRVVVLTANGFAFPVTDLAVMSLGAVKTPLNLMQSPAEVARAVEFVEPAAIVLDAAGSELAGQLPAGVPRLFVDEVIGRTGHGLPPAHDLPSSAPAALYLSSGTTGRPKGIVHSQESVLANLWAHLLQSGIGGTERLLLTTPLAHSAGLFTEAALLSGAHVRIEPGFDAQRWVDLVDEHQITWSYGVPTMVRRVVDICQQQGRRPDTLRTYQYGSAPMSPGLLAQAMDVFGPVLQQLYAQTECPQYATLLTKADHERALDRPELLASAGRDTVMCEVTVRAAADGSEIPPGEVGEVCLRSPYVMDDYWRDREGYLARFHGDWLRTGDVGYRDEAGYLYLVDRLADMIVTGGMNVYSVEVEAVLSRHPEVAHAVVVGVPDDEWGEAVTAVVVATPGADDEHLVEALTARCRAELAAYKRPKRYELSEAIPLTPYGKPDKKSIRQAYWGDATRKVN